MFVWYHPFRRRFQFNHLEFMNATLIYYCNCYDRVCVACHGRDLKTTGVAARDLRGFPIAERERFIRSVTHGTGDMPPFGKVLSEDEIEQIYSYVRAVQAAAP